MALVGAGTRGLALAESFLKLPDVRFAYVVEVDAAKRATAAALPGSPVTTDDLRWVLSDSKVGAVAITTPDHWTAPIAIAACQSRKDVFIEGAPGLTIPEGERIADAARKYGRSVQVALAHRDATFAKRARQIIVEEGLLGTLLHVNVFLPPSANEIDRIADDDGDDTSPVPRGLDWNRWLGPAPFVNYTPDRHKRWRNYWAYGGGPLMTDGFELIDLARMITGDPPPPRSVVCCGRGGSQERAPGSQAAICDFGSWNMLIQSGHGTGHPRAFGNHASRGHEQLFWRTLPHVQVTGTRTTMLIAPRGCGYVLFRNDGRWLSEMADFTRRSQQAERFIASLREGTAPLSSITMANPSAAIVHLANTSYRSGRTQLTYDHSTARVENDDAQRLQEISWREPYAPIQISNPPDSEAESTPTSGIAGAMDEGEKLLQWGAEHLPQAATDGAADRRPPP